VSNSARQGLLWVGLTAAVFALVTLVTAPDAGAQDTRVRLEVPSGPIGVDDAPFTVQVLVEDVADLGGFEFDLLYEPAVLSLVRVEAGPFLGSSGRRDECLDPQMAAGSVHFVCVTLGAMPAGPDGSGVLAVLTFDATSEGTSFLRFGETAVVRPDGQPITATTVDASVTVGRTPSTESPLATGTSEAPTPTAGTAAASTTPRSTAVAPTPTSTETPPAGGSTDNDGTNWALWGSVIGGIAALMAATAGVAWWSRTRGLP